ncbi:DUF4375 domain-containing protein [Solirubrobacter phytolaccae]|uniref:DUF4375 domain-containing protein n=1 Tax=Solirubrobacter phytolaccae TaxID=1404360 RepID=A0A9X3N451_9ACTN|nr:DUF4375 domain-containing protein [Solirubrobacter phytolaccae]MDA0179353.1 DUF4375 domain-containing protein [Solirubrobacter phytolaccae]
MSQAAIRALYDRIGDDPRSPGEEALRVLITAADEVAAGGFEQLYYFEPDIARRAPVCARLVTARRFERLFEAANAIAFEDPEPKRRRTAARRMLRAVESHGDQLAQLDNAFDALMADDAERIEVHLARYVEYHPHEFETEEGGRRAGQARRPEMRGRRVSERE